jgi:hypothetical protein
MQTYEIHQGQDLKAIVRVHDTGQKEWDFSPDVEWGGFWTENAKETIDRAIDLYPNEDFNLGGLTVRRRAD